VSTSPPKFIPPCRPINTKLLPRGVVWLHEPKLDGYRLQIVKKGGQVRLYSRGGHDWTRRMPCLAKALQDLACRSAVLDGELILHDRRGRPHFNGLSAAIRRSEPELTVYVFDLMHCDGADLRSLPLTERKRRLARLVARAKIPCLNLLHAFDDGAALFKWCEVYELEGIVSKRRDASYQSGECKNWRTVKTSAWREANRERWHLFEGQD